MSKTIEEILAPKPEALYVHRLFAGEIAPPEKHGPQVTKAPHVALQKSPQFQPSHATIVFGAFRLESPPL